jgi:hypothetical protein
MMVGTSISDEVDGISAPIMWLTHQFHDRMADNWSFFERVALRATVRCKLIACYTDPNNTFRVGRTSCGQSRLTWIRDPQLMIEPRVTCYHIYYDDASKKKCPDGFTPLLNINKFPDFRESIPILTCLKQKQWEDNEFVGFFSPKLREKTGVGLKEITNAVARHGDVNSVILFTSHWPEAAFYLNPWEQGEIHNPGILSASRVLANRTNRNIDLMTCCADLDQTVFSHFLVAQKPFWDEWEKTTQTYLDMISRNIDVYNFKTTYKGDSLSIHPFVVERIPTMIIIDNKITSIRYDHFSKTQLTAVEKKWMVLAELKKNFNITLKLEFLQKYWTLRLQLGTERQSDTATAKHYFLGAVPDT